MVVDNELGYSNSGSSNLRQTRVPTSRVLRGTVGLLAAVDFNDWLPALPRTEWLFFTTSNFKCFTHRTFSSRYYNMVLLSLASIALLSLRAFSALAQDVSPHM